MSAEFTKATKSLIAARAGYMCMNPDCNRLLVGPEVVSPDSYMKLGEVAHIQANKSTGARFDATMSDSARRSIGNAILLCPSCHTLVDKNSGRDYSVELLLIWRDKHLEKVRFLLTSARPVLPMLMRLEAEGAFAQQALDCLAARSLLFAPTDMEVWNNVIDSCKSLRSELRVIKSNITLDRDLRSDLSLIEKYLRDFMNVSQNANVSDPQDCKVHSARLLVLRSDTGRVVDRIAHRYSLDVPTELHPIVPTRVYLGR